MLFWLALTGCLFANDKDREGDDAGECSDAADNDVDGLFDCDDPDCAGSPDCDTPETDTDTDADSDTDADTDADSDTDADADTDTDVPCTIVVQDAFPSDGETNVYYRTTVEWTFSDVDPTATVAVSQAGSPVAGSSVWDDTTLVFTPTSPLAPSTQYDVQTTFSCGSPAVSWTTSAVGDPTTGSDLVGTTYAIDLASGRFVQPPGVGALIQQQLTVDLLLEVTTANTELETLLAFAEEGSSPPVQDLCGVTTSTPNADFADNPYFEIGPQTTTVDIDGISITVDDLFISGAFAADGSSIQGMEFAGSIDTRPLVDLVDPGGADDSVCQLVATFGIACQPCAGGGDYCLEVVVDSAVASELPGTSLVVRTQTDIDADPSCSGSSSGILCSTVGLGVAGAPALLLVGLAVRRRHFHRD